MQLSSLHNVGDGSYVCTFEAQDPASLNYYAPSSLMIVITLHGKPIEGSPFRPVIEDVEVEVEQAEVVEVEVEETEVKDVPAARTQSMAQSSATSGSRNGSVALSQSHAQSNSNSNQNNEISDQEQRSVQSGLSRDNLNLHPSSQQSPQAQMDGLALGALGGGEMSESPPPFAAFAGGGARDARDGAIISAEASAATGTSTGSRLQRARARASMAKKMLSDSNL